VDLVAILISAAGALVVGVLGGAFGVGGGIFLVPFLTIVVGLRPVEAVGVSLFCVIGTSASASSVTLKSGEANLGLGLMLEPFLIAGAVLAGLVAQQVTDAALLLGFALVIVVIGALFLRQALGRGLPTPVAPVEPARFADGSSAVLAYRPQRLPLVMSLATLGGVASGLFGIGGGVVTVPLLSQVARVPIRAAAATASLSLMVTAGAAGAIHLAHGTVPPAAVAAALVGILPGGLFGARLQHRLPERLMRFVFAGLGFFVAGSIVWRTLR
jgi:uncharacterized protein